MQYQSVFTAQEESVFVWIVFYESVFPLNIYNFETCKLSKNRFT